MPLDDSYPQRIQSGKGEGYVLGRCQQMWKKKKIANL